MPKGIGYAVSSQKKKKSKRSVWENVQDKFQKLVEFTDREKKIVLIKYIIHGVSPYSELPMSTRTAMLKASAKFLELSFDEAEWLDIGEACLAVQKQVQDSAMGFIETNKDMVDKALSMMGKGNDRLKL